MNRSKHDGVAGLSRAILIGCLLMQTSFVRAATYYVDSVDGTDDANGLAPDPQSEDIGPWRTLAHVNRQKFSPGDDILLRRDATYSTAPLIINHGGLPDNPVIISAYGSGSKPRLDGATHGSLGLSIEEPGLAHYIVESLAVHSITGGQSIAVSDVSYVTLRDLDIRDNATRNGIFITRSHQVTVDGASISNMHNSGVAIIGSADDRVSHVTVRNCVITDVHVNDGITVHEDGNGNPAASHFLIESNDVSNCAEQAYDITSGSDVLLRHNRSRDCHDGSLLISGGAHRVAVLNHDSHADSLGAGAALIIDAADVLVAGSRFHGNAYRFASIETTGTVAVINNLFEVPDAMTYPIDIFSEDGVTFANNIVVSPSENLARAIRFFSLSGAANSIKHRIDHNLYYGIRPDDDRIMYVARDERLLILDDFRSIYGKEQQGRIIDPLFTPAADNPWALLPESPCIDAGLEVTNLPALPPDAVLPIPVDGNGDTIIAPDIGPEEYGYRAVDSDGDGMIDADEVVASTEPRDPTSRLAITALTAVGNASLQVTWTSVSGIMYDVQAVDLVTGSLSPLQTGILAVATETTVTIAAPSNGAAALVVTVVP